MMRNTQSSTGDLAASLARMERGRTLSRELRMQQPEPFSGYAQPLLDAAALFDELGIGYALVGGVAAMVYGRARFTEDIDFVAARPHPQMLAENPDVMRRHRFDPACTWKLYHESGIEIDLWKDEHAEAIIARARQTPLAGRGIPIAGPHDLIAMKLRANRPQDDYDISEIVKHTAIDDAAVQALVTPDQHAHYLAVKKRVGFT